MLVGRVMASLSLLVGACDLAWSQSSPVTVETRLLIVSAADGRMPEARLKAKADEAQAMLDRVLEFWSADAGVDRFGKIHVVFDAPLERDTYSSVLVANISGGRRVRTVRVFGSLRAPENLVHKLTTAVLAQPDKLIRNMIGVATEERIGNRLSHPSCGFRSDDWVLALSNLGLRVPLAELGPDHESWGMQVGADGTPAVFDRARQSRAYAEAGSFGGYLIETFGIEKMKRLQRLSLSKARPWPDVYGMTLQELEDGWMNSLRAKAGSSREVVTRLTSLWKANPKTACSRAQALGRKVDHETPTRL